MPDAVHVPGGAPSMPGRRSPPRHRTAPSAAAMPQTKKPRTNAGLSDRAVPPRGRPPPPAGEDGPGQAAASLSFFSGRTLTFTDAGLAANHCSSLVKGLMPLRLGLAGTLTEVIFRRPGRVKLPMPFLLIEPCTAPSSEASTARTSFAARPVDSAMWETRPDLVSASLIGLGAAGFAGAAFFGAAFLTALVAFFAI